jgi:hypothetical protein
VVARLGRPNEIVIRAVQRFGHRLKARRVLVRKFRWRQALLLRGLDHLLTMLVRAGKEEHIHAIEPAETRQRIGCQ